MTQSGNPNDQVRGTASRRERERAERRDDILRAAREVFFQGGFHTVTVDDIAVAAEVGKGTVYLYFDTKETILAHLLLEGLDMLSPSWKRPTPPIGGWRPHAPARAHGEPTSNSSSRIPDTIVC
jgi:AcrR family transcriptional regulator